MTRRSAGLAATLCAFGLAIAGTAPALALSGAAPTPPSGQPAATAPGGTEGSAGPRNVEEAIRGGHAYGVPARRITPERDRPWPYRDRSRGY